MRRPFFLFILIICASLVGCADERLSAAASPSGLVTASPGASPSAYTPSLPFACIPARSRREQALAKRAVDGESLTVSIGGVSFSVRYIGIQAPDEKTDKKGAQAAAAQNRARVEGRTVILARDVSEEDPSGRLLRYVLVDGEFLNENLIRGGFVSAAFSAPDESCQEEFRNVEETAQRSRIGIWSAGLPALTQTSAASTAIHFTPSPGCLIKGNINSQGEKIYHLPGTRGYAQTVIEPAKGERWFCSEAEAQAAGWRRGKS